MPVDPPNRILVVKLSAIGDVLMATPVARALRTAFPESHIAWVVERKAADVVLGNPCLDEVIVWDRRKWGGAFGWLKGLVMNASALRRALDGRRFDVALDLQGLLRSALVACASGAGKRIGFSDAAECSTLFYNVKHDPGELAENAQQRNLDMLRALGVQSTDTQMLMPITDIDREFARGFLARSELSGVKMVGICPATTRPNKHWTREGWSRVIDLIAERTGARALIFGAKADIEYARGIAEGVNTKVVIAAGETTLKQAAALMEQCVAIAGVDTGLIHMAVALDRPTVGLFGSSDWRCHVRKDNTTWLTKDYPCSPCGMRPKCKDIDCMSAFEPEEVAEAVQRWVV